MIPKTVEAKHVATKFLTEVFQPAFEKAGYKVEIIVDTYQLRVKNRIFVRAQANQYEQNRVYFNILDGHFKTLKTYRARKDGTLNDNAVEEAIYAARACFTREQAYAKQEAAYREAKKALVGRNLLHVSALRKRGVPTLCVRFEITPEKLDHVIAVLKSVGIEL